MKLPKWITGWSPFIGDTKYKRRDFLVYIRSIHEDCKLLPKQSFVRQEFIHALAKTGVLSLSQIASVVKCSKQAAYTHMLKVDTELRGNNSVRGRFNPDNISAMLEVITRLEGQDYVPEIMMASLLNGTDPSLINHLIGIPYQPLRTAEKRVAEDDGLKGYFRVPNR